MGPRLNDVTKEMSNNELRRIIRTARQIGVMEVVFFGGEPLMRPGITDLVRFTRDQGLLPILFTNGIQLAASKVKELKAAGLVQANVSLDSGLPAIHDQNRRLQGCFDRAIAGIRNLAEQNIRCRIWTFANREKLDDGEREMRELVRLGRELNVDRIMVLFPIATGNWICAWEQILTPEERVRFRAFHDGRSVSLEFFGEEAYCRAAKKVFYVSPEGDTFPCPGIPVSYGNVLNEHLLRILHRMGKDLETFSCRTRGECIMQDREFRKKLAQEGPYAGMTREQ
jgi:MoaA/NifB/PqqE/SkfB family radical SAM enzyme